MTFLEVVGFAWIAFTTVVGHYVIGRCAWRGGKATWDSDKADHTLKRRLGDVQ